MLVVALAGCTGAGKSALINALAGAEIAEVSEKRPTTTRLRVYHHRDIPSGGLPADLASAAAFVPHDRSELRTKVLIDTPDLDSFATQHRATTKQVLQAAGLVLYVFSPEKYLEERTWSVLREERHFSASAAVLNKIDRVSSEELEHIITDLRHGFADIGLEGIRIFRTCAIAHVPDPHRLWPLPPPETDDTLALRAFLEHELQASDVARLQREQYQRVVAHLQEEVERVAPEATLEHVDEVVAAITPYAVEVAAQFTRVFAERLAAVEEEFVALATLRQHERFHGPFRTWLLGTDCLRFGLKRIGRWLAGGIPQTGGNLIEETLTRGTTAASDDLLRDTARRLQDLLYTRELPVERWRVITAKVNGGQFVAEVAAELETRFRVATAAPQGQGRIVIQSASALGTAVPAGLVLLGLLVSSRDLLTGHYVGLPLFGHLLAMGMLFFLALQAGVNRLLPSAWWQGHDIAQQAVQTVTTRTWHRWLEAYRNDLAADLADLREPLVALQHTITTRGEVLEGITLPT
jgi:hypothetical protein